MPHQVEILAVEHLAKVKQARSSRLNFLPTIILNLLSHVGALPPSHPKHISDIISRSLRTKSIGALSSLSRNGCTIDFSQLSAEMKSVVLNEIRTNSAMVRGLCKVITDIPTK